MTVLAAAARRRIGPEMNPWSTHATRNAMTVEPVEHEQHDAAEMPYAFLLLRAVRLQIDRADALAAQHDRPEHSDAIVGHRDRRACSIRARGATDVGSEAGAVVGRERAAVDGVDVRVRDLGLVGQRFQRVAHRLRIVERQRGGAAGAEQIGQRL